MNCPSSLHLAQAEAAKECPFVTKFRETLRGLHPRGFGVEDPKPPPPKKKKKKPDPEPYKPKP